MDSVFGVIVGMSDDFLEFALCKIDFGEIECCWFAKRFRKSKLGFVFRDGHGKVFALAFIVIVESRRGEILWWRAFVLHQRERERERVKVRMFDGTHSNE